MPQNPTPAAAGNTNPTTNLTPEQRTKRLADLRAQMAARNVVLSGGPLMSLPLNRRIAFAISDPGAITPRGDDYREPLHVWQARAVEFVLPNVSELKTQAEKVASFCDQRAEYVTSILNCHPDNAHDYYRWQGHAESRRQLSQSLGLPVAWPAETEPRTAPAPVEDEDSHAAKVAEYLSTPYTDDFPSQREAGAL